MDALGDIEIRIEGSVDARKLTPALVDIDDMEYSDAYLDGLMKKAAPAWENISDSDKWLEEIRGGAHV